MTTTKPAKPYRAGVWEQYADEDGGNGFVTWSRHSTRALAEIAARRYARTQEAIVGGVHSWSGGVCGPDGEVTWVA